MLYSRTLLVIYFKDSSEYRPRLILDLESSGVLPVLERSVLEASSRTELVCDIHNLTTAGEEGCSNLLLKE